MNRLLRLPPVLTFYPVKKTAFYSHIEHGLFTKPVRLGTLSVWPEQEVEAIVAARIAGASDDDIRALVAELHAQRKAAA